MNPEIADATLNALNAQIAVLDVRGRIVAVNEAWKRFARQNGGENETFYIGANYLEICETAARSGEDASAKAILDGVGELLRRERTSVSVEYPCDSPYEQRWFVVQVTSFVQAGEMYLVATHEDITSQKQSQAKLRESEATLSNVLETLPVGVWILDAKGQIVHGNPESQRIWGGARYVGPDQFDEYKGWWLSTGRRIEAQEWAAARAITKGEISIDEEIRIECFDGSSKIILNSGTPLRDDAGKIVGVIIVNQDITARKRVEEDLRQANAEIDATNRELQQALQREQLKARTDDLTGLTNRRHFYELSYQLFYVAKRYRTPFSVLMFDVDHFKQINDHYGHQVGDLVLEWVARVVREHTREADVAARYGGEEFIAVLPNTTACEALAVAENIREKISTCREVFTDGKIGDLGITISAGVAEILSAEDTLDQLVQRADQALYEAKRAGRNCSRIFSPAA